MIETRTIGNSIWIDATAPTRAELEHIRKEYKMMVPIHVLLDYAMQPSIKHHHNAIHAILRFPRKFSNTKNLANTSFEIDFVCTENLLLTIHDIPLFELDIVGEILDKKSIDIHGHYDLCFVIIHEFYNTVRDTLIEISDTIENLELNVFETYNRKSIIDITQTIRSIINIERSLRPHEAVINRLETIFDHVPQAAAHHRNRIVDLSREILVQLTTNRDILIEMRWVHSALLTHQTNKILMTFTMISFIALPIAFTTDIFGLVHSPVYIEYRNPMLISVTIIMGLIVYYFHKHKWL